MGILRRKTDKSASKVKAMVIKNTDKATLHPIIRENVEPGTIINTHAWSAYRGLSPSISMMLLIMRLSMSTVRCIRMGLKISGASSSAPSRHL